MEQDKNPISKQLQDILGTKVNISESPKTRAKKEQEMFCHVVDLWDKTWQRGNKMFDEFQVDMGEYDAHFYNMIEGLFIMTYGELKAEVIAWWVYERFAEDGELLVLVDDEENQYEIKTSLELFKFIKKL
jgi:hypothetical protein